MYPPPANIALAAADGGPWQARRVLLFSGHMVDAPDRARPRFPASKQAAAAIAVASALDSLQAGPDDLGLTQGACGGDILFAEACLARGVKLQLLQPFTEAEFIAHSVLPGQADWLPRYQAIVAQLPNPPLAAPHALGPLAESENPYERCNLWLLHTALAAGLAAPAFMCLWDGGGGDGPGGTAHMVAEVEQAGGRVVWLDTRTL
ncbi:hypothetical protein [Methylomonas sp. HYX-M1]|uniref:hypothetical protein n=1 Tax=Methylomonas sp. HYX-M1 TaxID=3139307 RepID=UPI00345C191E